MGEKEVRQDRSAGEITAAELEVEIDNGKAHGHKMQRPDARAALPDKMTVTLPTKCSACFAVAISENKAAENEEEINPQITSVSKTKAGDIGVKKWNAHYAVAQVKECYEQSGHAAHGGETLEGCRGRLPWGRSRPLPSSLRWRRSGDACPLFVPDADEIALGRRGCHFLR